MANSSKSITAAVLLMSVAMFGQTKTTFTGKIITPATDSSSIVIDPELMGAVAMVVADDICESVPEANIWLKRKDGWKQYPCWAYMQAKASVKEDKAKTGAKP